MGEPIEVVRFFEFPHALLTRFNIPESAEIRFTNRFDITNRNTTDVVAVLWAYRQVTFGKYAGSEVAHRNTMFRLLTHQCFSPRLPEESNVGPDELKLISAMKIDLAGYRFEDVQRKCVILRSKHCSQDLIDKFEDEAREGKFDMKAIPKPETAPRRVKVKMKKEEEEEKVTGNSFD